MDDHQIILRPKKWLRTIFYILSPFFLLMMGYIFFQVITEEAATGGELYVHITLIISAGIGFILLLFLIPTYYRHRVVITNNSIRKDGIITTEIDFKDIQSITLRKGGLEIKGDQLFKRISLGDLYTRYEEAFLFLSGRLSDHKQISLKGRDPIIQEFIQKGTAIS